MKKLIYLIMVIVALGLIVPGCIPVVPPSEQSELSNIIMPSVLKSNGGITIDGTLIPGEWDSYFWFTDNSEGPGTGYDDDPLPVFTGYLHFDETNLYLAFDVEDTTPNTNRDFLYVTIDIPPAMEFNFSVDALYWGSLPATPSFFGEAYLTGGSFPWDRSQRGSTWGTDGGVVTARTITDTNRYYELMIPLDAISASLGDTIGLKIQARGGQYRSPTDPQVVNYFPDMPDNITPIRADTRVEFPGNFYQFTLEIEVPIDIKPGSDPNSINPKAKGLIPVAILTTPDFDATTVDWTTVKFGPDAAKPVHDLSDLLVLADHQQDVDEDGDVDFVFHFRTQETGITTGHTSATLTGKTYGGIPIVGTDTVRIVGK